jgi:acyl transferase domain-containing protein
MELSAIGQTFGASRSAEQTPLYVGTIKSNIGHTEGCAGLAGVLKAVLCLEKGLLPPNAGFENLNPKLRLEDWRIALPESTMAWPSSGVRRVSVNSFGYGGSNAHAILDDAHGYLSTRGLFGNHQTSFSKDSDSDSGISTGALTPTDDSDLMFKSKRKLLVFSSQDQGGIQRISASYQQFFEKLNNESKNSDLSSKIASLAYTLASRRTRFDYRSFAVADTSQDLVAKLAAGLPKLKRVSKHANSIWVFTGQGAQWPSMGKQLLGQRVFRASILQTQTYLESFGCPWDVVEELEKTDDSRIDFPEFSQPICTALQIALVDLLHHWGLKPKATVGHSSGEIGKF